MQTPQIGNRQSAIGKVVECVPNFSEGRKTDVVDDLAATIEQIDSACVLDIHLDPDHNRSVITFVAAPKNVVTAAVAAVARAAELIDMRKHQGVHPRLGATDVLPFVPVRGVSMDECVEFAHAAGKRIAEELSIPVYFYERAALRPERIPLENVRRGALETLRERIASDPNRIPDVGPLKIHETAGVIAVGARPFLIAFNVNLATRDVSIARNIAKQVRARSGGLPFLKALGFELSTRGLAQVSMNLVNYEETGMTQAFLAVRAAAESAGVEVASTEIVGLIPNAALDREAEYFALLENFSEDKILETRMRICE
jgi:glutamate formiminotransferase